VEKERNGEMATLPQHAQWIDLHGPDTLQSSCYLECPGLERYWWTLTPSRISITCIVAGAFLSLSTSNQHSTPQLRA
jgi:hypothetical protein